MCGFIGYFSKDKINFSKEIHQAIKLIKHRGPDDEFTIIENNFGLGFTRLSIQDVSLNARQPMVSESKRFFLVFNGEIYNFKELRNQLLLKGHKFSSKGDAEVLLKMYEAEGQKCLSKIDGMFSFAIIDKIKNCLFLARDRFGMKPLYVYKSDKAIFFSSEIKAFIPFTIKGMEWNLNYQFLQEFLTYRELSGEKTFVKNVSKILPGHSMIVDKSLNININKYFNLSLNYFRETNLDLNENIDHLEEILIKNIKNHLISDVPVGVTLSGGLDSSLLTALIKKHSNINLTTYSVVFEEKRANGRTVDESKFINQVNDIYKGKSNFLKLTAKKFAEVWDDLIWHMRNF